MGKAHIKKWYDFVENHNTQALNDLIADDAVFYSPVVHTPQEGKAITYMYLSAAGSVLGNDSFEYIGEWLSENGAVLEFATEIDGIKINGVDIITFNTEGKISEFKVMLRPLKAVNMVHSMMGQMLQKMAG